MKKLFILQNRISNDVMNTSAYVNSKSQMKKYLTLFSFILITTLGFAQSNYQDVVHLKNGSIIRGLIIEQTPNKTIKLETADRNVFIYQMDEIEKLTKEQSNIKSNTMFNSNNKFKGSGLGLQKGHKAIVELGYQIGTGDFGIDRLKFNAIYAYQINPYFSLGIGTGLRCYFDAETALIPLFSDFRVNFLDNNISPYFSLGIGYSFNSNSDGGGGFLLNPAIGASFKISDKSAINVSLGYEMQKLEFFWYNDPDETFTENCGAISFTVGASF